LRLRTSQITKRTLAKKICPHRQHQAEFIATPLQGIQQALKNK
jgi:hypothetical protein